MMRDVKMPGAMALLVLAACGCGGGAEGSKTTGMEAVAGVPGTSMSANTAGAAAGEPAAAESGRGGTAASAGGAGAAAPSGSAGSDSSAAGAGGAEPSSGAAGAAAGSGGDAAAGTAAAPASGAGPLKPTMNVAEDGPYPTTLDAEADGGAGYLVYPTELGADGVKHPIFVWGTGSGSVPSQYEMHLKRLASHGFVVYSADTSSVTGALLRAGIDYLFAENERDGSPLYQKLDLTKVGVGGHSLGSLSTYDIADDERITTTIHVDGGQFDGMGGPRLKKPALFICGEDSWGTPNCNNDYEGSAVPIFYTRIEGLIGAEGHIMAADAGLEIWLAWMRWQLGAEEERRKDFLDPMCTYCTGKYDSQSKNW
jgi:hypothetical protein